MGRFPVVYGSNCQNRNVTPKTFHSYAYKNISWYIQYRTVIVAFNNKWSWGAPRGPSLRLYQEMGRFPIVYGREQLQKSKCCTKNLWFYAYQNISWYIWIYQEIGRLFYVFESNCQNESVTPKTFCTDRYKNLFRYMPYPTIMVAFRNKWSWGPPWGLSIRLS